MNRIKHLNNFVNFRSLAASPGILYCSRKPLSPISQFRPSRSIIPRSAQATRYRCNSGFLEVQGKHIVPAQSSKINVLSAGWDYSPRVTKNKKKARTKEGTNEDTFCSRCWSNVLDVTRGWRRAVFYLPLSCILAWRPNKLWLSYVAAGLLAVLSLLHIASSALRRRGPCQLSTGIDSVGESLLNSRQENYDRFEEVLVRFLTLLH
ncbi:hypothetical protein X777_14809 [Ooceraea biroi]|uniref:Transmembrane protein n=1 Tax=Ooceraea biroi TaxID=2015173 RepID=A0A026WRI1_OOCBI|nr:hypothetical protein X777_14809 [Ooceraea biroi]